MKKIFSLMLIVLAPSIAFAEYPELKALETFSHQQLSKIAKRLSRVPSKYKGVVRYANSLKSLKSDDEVDIPKITYRSKDYWRAVLEMSPKDPSVLFSHAYLHLAQGETAYADIYMELGSLTMDKKFQSEIKTYAHHRAALDRRIKRDIDVGIKHHDSGSYTSALSVYDNVISNHPNCAWAYYEKGQCYLAMDTSNPNLELKQKKKDAFKKCRDIDPFYWMAYQGDDAEVINNMQILISSVVPYLSGKKRNVASLVSFAEGCEKLKLYPIAAHTRWKLLRLDSNHLKTHLKIFLDLLEKCGCEDPDFFRSQFKLSE